ncbi:MAG: Unknown protein [uncultured Sulfurovum sp.]|uniref:Uncharacterized protein n=1 Tax=uncultured Sulfurovum sp. TaxID=269237 RepID=A0A6S6TRZ4_9BACT|nr:MAG: Unknown protein [uncultured Sulfurovum sp.]
MIAHKQPEGLESYYEYDEYIPKGKVEKSWNNRDESWSFEYEIGLPHHRKVLSNS